MEHENWFEIGEYAQVDEGVTIEDGATVGGGVTLCLGVTVGALQAAAGRTGGGKSAGAAVAADRSLRRARG